MNENVELKFEIAKQLEETIEKVEEVITLMSMSEKIVEYDNEMLACMPLARVYTLYLK